MNGFGAALEYFKFKKILLYSKKLQPVLINYWQTQDMVCAEYAGEQVRGMNVVRNVRYTKVRVEWSVYQLLL